MRKIFIQIASYRDPNLLTTIQTAWKMATYPNRLRFGICVQDDKDEFKSLRNALWGVPKKQISFKFVPHQETQGLCWARQEAQNFYDGEDYELQIDSHMRFHENWDTKGIKMLTTAPKDKAVLTHYCPQWSEGETKKEVAEQMPWSLQADTFGKDDDEMPDILYLAGGFDSTRKVLHEHAFVSGHFLLAPGEMFTQVPLDPNSGFGYEEGAMGVRIWTHGWNLFAPNEVLARHTWNRSIRTVVWDDQINLHQTLMSTARKRWRRLVGMDNNPLKQFGLGTKRTLSQYEKFTGLNFKERTLNNMAKAGLVKGQYENMGRIC